jgi:SAM-dependent methyltransferase
MKGFVIAPVDQSLLLTMKLSSAQLSRRFGKRSSDRSKESLVQVLDMNKAFVDEMANHLANRNAKSHRIGLKQTVRPVIDLLKKRPIDKEDVEAARDLAWELVVSATRDDQFDRTVVKNLGRDLIALALGPENLYLLPALEPRSAPPMNTWTCQNEVMDWDIKVGDRVLDVGSGGWPFTRATHLADMYTGETSHRREELRRDTRPFLTIDITKMPFRDKAWDFVFCSHVLEHLTEPGTAMRELVRVSRRGYIEAPTRLSDVMLNFTGMKDHHRWHSLLLGETLVFVEWRDDERRDLGTKYFFQCLHSEYNNEFQTYFETNWDFFFSRYRWEERIRFLVIDKTGTVVDRSE